MVRAHRSRAEFVALPAELAVPLPANIGFAGGACLGIPVMTAHRCLLGDGDVAGKTVLVTGGAGVVGHYAIQLAKWRGAKVIATTSSEAKATHARAAGADFVVDYKSEAVADRVLELTVGCGVDRIVEVDLGANLPVTVRVLAAGGTVSAYASMGVREPALPVYPMMARNTKIDMVLLSRCPTSTSGARSPTSPPGSRRAARSSRSPRATRGRAEGARRAREDAPLVALTARWHRHGPRASTRPRRSPATRLLSRPPGSAGPNRATRRRRGIHAARRDA